MRVLVLLWSKLEVRLLHSRLGAGLEGVTFATCGSCNYCTFGQDILCYSRSIFVEDDFNNGTLARISSEEAVPLQCADYTVYGALIQARNGIHPSIGKYPLSNEGITTKIQKLTNGKIRYRAFLIQISDVLICLAQQAAAVTS
ncbi:hypothetical protein LI328DRAFT_163391 [Trichoderma asperelloides]|nr:hypothetical protein LI328DRAFT_163391 [Trichoderma asperelloides]